MDPATETALIVTINCLFSMGVLEATPKGSYKLGGDLDLIEDVISHMSTTELLDLSPPPMGLGHTDMAILAAYVLDPFHTSVSWFRISQCMETRLVPDIEKRSCGRLFKKWRKWFVEVGIGNAVCSGLMTYNICVTLGKTAESKNLMLTSAMADALDRYFKLDMDNWTWTLDQPLLVKLDVGGQDDDDEKDGAGEEAKVENGCAATGAECSESGTMNETESSSKNETEIKSMKKGGEMSKETSPIVSKDINPIMSNDSLHESDPALSSRIQSDPSSMSQSVSFPTLTQSVSFPPLTQSAVSKGRQPSKLIQPTQSTTPATWSSCPVDLPALRQSNISNNDIIPPHIPSTNDHYSTGVGGSFAMPSQPHFVSPLIISATASFNHSRTPYISPPPPPPAPPIAAASPNHYQPQYISPHVAATSSIVSQPPFNVSIPIGPASFSAFPQSTVPAPFDPRQGPYPLDDGTSNAGGPSYANFQ